MSTRKSSPTRPTSKQQSLLTSLDRVWAEIRLAANLEFRVSCVRPDDLLVCDFIFENLRLDSTGDEPRLVRKNSATPVLIVEFPPQSFGEEAFLESAGKDNPDLPDLSPAKVPPETFPERSSAVKPTNVPLPPQDVGELPSARIRRSGPSRIAFSMPVGETE